MKIELLIIFVLLVTVTRCQTERSPNTTLPIASSVTSVPESPVTTKQSPGNIPPSIDEPSEEENITSFITPAASVQSPVQPTAQQDTPSVQNQTQLLATPITTASLTPISIGADQTSRKLADSNMGSPTLSPGTIAESTKANATYFNTTTTRPVVTEAVQSIPPEANTNNSATLVPATTTTSLITKTESLQNATSDLTKSLNTSQTVALPTTPAANTSYTATMATTVQITTTTAAETTKAIPTTTDATLEETTTTTTTTTTEAASTTKLTSEAASPVFDGSVTLGSPLLDSSTDSNSTLYDTNENIDELLDEVLEDILGLETSSYGPTINETLDQVSNTTISQSSSFFDTSGSLYSVILISSLSVGILFFVTVTILVSRRVYDGWKKRHYSRIDYLVNGMYN